MKLLVHVLPFLLGLGVLLLPGSLRANVVHPGASWKTLPGLSQGDLDPGVSDRALAILFLEVLTPETVVGQTKTPGSPDLPALALLLELPTSALDELADWADLRAFALDRRVYEFSGTDPPPGTTRPNRVRDSSYGVVTRAGQTASNSKTRVRASGVPGAFLAWGLVPLEARPALDLGASGTATRTGVHSFSSMFRHVRPGLGRWISRDPGFFIDGPNRYAWLRNNPLRYVDPNGLRIKEILEGDYGNAIDLGLAFELTGLGLGFATGGPIGAAEVFGFLLIGYKAEDAAGFGAGIYYAESLGSEDWDDDSYFSVYQAGSDVGRAGYGVGSALFCLARTGGPNTVAGRDPRSGALKIPRGSRRSFGTQGPRRLGGSSVGASGAASGSSVVGPSGRTSIRKYLEKRWDKATFPSIRKTIEYHVGKHGKGLDPVTYTQRALRAFSDSNAVRTATTNVQGRAAMHVRSIFGTGLFTVDGRIIWFHPK